jgi:hypothetical protein
MDSGSPHYPRQNRGDQPALEAAQVGFGARKVLQRGVRLSKSKVQAHNWPISVVEDGMVSKDGPIMRQAGRGRV